MYDFVAIDFETASSDLSSACAIGIAAVENLELVDSFYSLIRPPRNYYDYVNTSIHGITPEMTADAPTLTELWPQISRFFNEHIPVVAHNARFDMSVLRLSTDEDIPDFIYVDTINIASFFREGHKDLISCAKTMGVYSNGFNHHNAQSDAVLCAKIAAKGIGKLSCTTMWEFLCKYPDVKSKIFYELNPQKMLNKNLNSRFQKIDIQSITPTVEKIDESSPLYGKILVFTGELSLERAEAMQIAVNAGAILKNSVSSKTDFLVVGTQDKSLVGDDGMSTKEEKAHALNEAGKANVVFLSEEEFLHLANAESAADQNFESWLLQICSQVLDKNAVKYRHRNSMGIRLNKKHNSLLYRGGVVFTYHLTKDKGWVAFPTRYTTQFPPHIAFPQKVSEDKITIRVNGEDQAKQLENLYAAALDASIHIV